MTKIQRQTAAAVAKLKAGDVLTPTEERLLDQFRQHQAEAGLRQKAIEILARTDALMELTRQPIHLDPIQARLEQQFEFIRDGIRWKRGGTGAERTAASKELQAMEKAKLIVVRRHNDRATHVKLTDATDWQLRALVGEPSLPETLAVMLLIWDAENRGDYCQDNDGNRYVPERIIGEFDPYNDRKWYRRAVELEQRIMPGHLRGWISVVAECGHRLYCYGLTDAGRAVLDKPPKMRLPDFDATSADLYFQTWRTAREELKHARLRDPNNINISPYLIDPSTVNELRREEEEALKNPPAPVPSEPPAWLTTANAIQPLPDFAGTVPVEKQPTTTGENSNA